jgi:glycosyltransferase involved in cell wall biosynthesis
MEFKTIILIPAFNEEDAILSTISNLKKYKPDINYLIINDASTDNTETICKENNLNYISLPFNLGIGGAIQTGFQYAIENGYDIGIQFDGDGQHNPEYIEDLIKPIKDEEAEMVIGSRFIDKVGFQSSKSRRLGIIILNIIIHLVTGFNIKDSTSGFRAFNKRMMSFLYKDYPKDYPEPECVVMAKRKGFRIKEIPVIMNEREGGESSISSFKSIYYMIKVSLAVLIDYLKYKKVK